MRAIEQEMPLFKSLMELISGHMGKKCEVVLHDWSKGYEKSVVAIENGHITGRSVGSCGSNLGLEVIKGNIKDGDRFNYITQTKDGRYLRSSTVYIKDDEGEPIGAMCINLDISDLIFAQKTLESLTMVENSTEEYFANDVSELLDFMLSDSVNKIGKTVSQMNREDKKKALGYLDEKGAFLISKASVKACRFFDISKYTLYNYLEEIRAQK